MGKNVHGMILFRCRNYSFHFFFGLLLLFSVSCCLCCCCWGRNVFYRNISAFLFILFIRYVAQNIFCMWVCDTSIHFERFVYRIYFFADFFCHWFNPVAYRHLFIGELKKNIGCCPFVIVEQFHSDHRQRLSTHYELWCTESTDDRWKSTEMEEK